MNLTNGQYLVAAVVALALVYLISRSPFPTLKQLFSESNLISFGRVACFMALCFALYWVTIIVRHTHALPDFSGLTLFVSSLYGITKAAQVVRDKMKGGVQGIDQQDAKTSGIPS